MVVCIDDTATVDYIRRSEDETECTSVINCALQLVAW